MTRLLNHIEFALLIGALLTFTVLAYWNAG